MEEPPPDLETHPRPGAGARRIGAFLDALLRYLEARGVLLSVESQEAAQHLLSVVIRSVLAAVFGFTGWLMLMAAVTRYLTVGPEWSASQAIVTVALVNLVFALVSGFAASRRLTTTRWFEHTLGEFGKDRAWLGQLNDKH